MGLSIATLLAQHNEVVAVDVIPEKVAAINDRRSPIKDEYIESFFVNKSLNLKATLKADDAYCGAEFVIVAILCLTVAMAIFQSIFVVVLTVVLITTAIVKRLSELLWVYLQLFNLMWTDAELGFL